MSVWVALVGLLAGAAVGPFLAGLTLSVPAGDPVLGKRWWRGGRAPGRRVLVVTGLAAVVLGAVAGRIGWSPELAAFGYLGAVGLTLAVIDLDCLRLPDRLTLPSYPVGVALLAVPGDWSALGRGLLAMAVAAVVTFLLPIGFGDVKLLGLLGLFLGWLGWGDLLLGVVLGVFLGALVAVALLAGRRAGRRDEFAYGPWLIAGALVAVVVS